MNFPLWNYYGDDVADAIQETVAAARVEFIMPISQPNSNFKRRVGMKNPARHTIPERGLKQCVLRIL